MDTDLMPAQALTLGLAAIALALVLGKRWLGRDNLTTAVPGFRTA